MKNGKVTLGEIARQAGTSTMTVSAVLNGSRSNTRVADETRKRIEKLAAELNYSPNAMARGLRRQRTDTIGVLFTWAGSRTIHNLYSMTVLDGIVAGAATAGYHILLYTQRWESVAASAAAFADQRTDGMIVVAPLESSDVVAGLTELGIPLAVISSSVKDSCVPGVNIDNDTGMTLGLDHLAALGHTQIAYVGPTPERRSMRERHDVYLRWMAEHELPVPEGYVLADLNIGESLQPDLERLLRLPEPPTAVFAANDDLAVEVLEAARTVGLSVPEQLSVVGFDDVLVASLTTPKLTTIRLPLYEMGQQAAQLLVARIEGRSESEGPSVQIISPELIVRDSTAAAPAVHS
ncbi:LacI family DNA-binding transcriptional regulator [Armatimonas sp.]|uniref:LacI family DNA-binding transcriptional regulator n=1 Tax=Armatimonas sp. TaxID=1872638 RepID=UPI00286AE3E5|nr:LacI family DNA-binding transcriptional regulator [Armatimonas sp.]